MKKLAIICTLTAMTMLSQATMAQDLKPITPAEFQSKVELLKGMRKRITDILKGNVMAVARSVEHQEAFSALTIDPIAPDDIQIRKIYPNQLSFLELAKRCDDNGIVDSLPSCQALADARAGKIKIDDAIDATRDLRNQALFFYKTAGTDALIQRLTTVDDMDNSECVKSLAEELKSYAPASQQSELESLIAQFKTEYSILKQYVVLGTNKKAIADFKDLVVWATFFRVTMMEVHFDNQKVEFAQTDTTRNKLLTKAASWVGAKGPKPIRTVKISGADCEDGSPILRKLSVQPRKIDLID